MNRTRIIVISGVIQEEAPVQFHSTFDFRKTAENRKVLVKQIPAQRFGSLGKPVLVMRNTTERPEALEAGTVKLVGTNKDLIIQEVSKLIENAEYYNTMAQANNPYGDGKACGRIVKKI